MPIRPMCRQKSEVVKEVTSPEEWEKLWEEGEVASSILPANIEEVRELNPCESLAFLNLAIAEGTFFYKGRKLLDSNRLEPVIVITMSEYEFLKEWGERLGVSVRETKRKYRKMTDEKVAKFTEPLYWLYNAGARLKKMLLPALTMSIGKRIVDAVPEAKIIIDLGSFVVPLDVKIKGYYSLITSEDRNELYALYKTKIRNVPLPRRVVVKITEREIGQIIRLRYQGFSLSEISEIIGVPPSTIWDILKRRGFK